MQVYQSSKGSTGVNNAHSSSVLRGLHEKSSPKFLTNIQSILRTISIDQLLKNEDCLDVLYERYKPLGTQCLNPIFLGGKTIQQDPVNAFRILENNLNNSSQGAQRINTKQPQSFHVSGGYPPESIIHASHGGGWRYIKDFLSQRIAGYPLEREGVGIQVSPNSNTRDQYYADRRTRFDSPAILRFDIQAQHLESANNGHEAGLKSGNIDKMSDISLQNLNTGVLIEARNVEEVLDKIK